MLAASVAVGVFSADAARAAEIEDAWQLFNAGEYAECVELAEAEIADGNYMWDPLESTCRHASLSIL